MSTKLSSKGDKDKEEEEVSRRLYQDQYRYQAERVSGTVASTAVCELGSTVVLYWGLASTPRY